jgi:sec-independent protein translocase protein TatA
MFLKNFGLPELIIILVVVLLLFGVGRINKIAGEMGKSIRSFRKGLSGDEDEDEKEDTTPSE